MVLVGIGAIQRDDALDRLAVGVEHDARQAQQRRADLDAERTRRLDARERGADQLVGARHRDAGLAEQLEHRLPRHLGLADARRDVQRHEGRDQPERHAAQHAHVGGALHRIADGQVERGAGLFVGLDVVDDQVAHFGRRREIRDLAARLIEVERGRGPRRGELHEGALALLAHQPALAREVLDRLAHGDARDVEHPAQLRLGRDLVARAIGAVADPGAQRDVDLVVARRRDVAHAGAAAARAGARLRAGADAPPSQSSTRPPERFITVPVTKAASGLTR